MSEPEWAGGEHVSLFAVGTTLLRKRRMIMLWMLGGGVFAATIAFMRGPVSIASASFSPQGQSDASRSGLASLAGQLGVSIPIGNQSLSPEFYARLLTSRVLLLPIVRDTFVVQEKNGRHLTFTHLFDVAGKTDPQREEMGVALLRSLVTVSVFKPTGVVELSVATPWRSVSLSIANALLSGVNDYNQRARQTQAAAERKFVEGRMALAESELRASENRLEGFMKSNRQFGNSPELAIERERIQRDVTMKQQVFTLLTQAFEDARIREVRDTPLVTVVEPPWAPTLPEPRRRLLYTLFGLILGGSIGALKAFATAILARRRSEGDADAERFFSVVRDIKQGTLGRLHRRRTGAQSTGQAR